MEAETKAAANARAEAQTAMVRASGLERDVRFTCSKRPETVFENLHGTTVVSLAIQVQRLNEEASKVAERATVEKATIALEVAQQHDALRHAEAELVRIGRFACAATHHPTRE